MGLGYLVSSFPGIFLALSSCKVKTEIGPGLLRLGMFWDSPLDDASQCNSVNSEI